MSNLSVLRAAAKSAYLRFHAARGDWYASIDAVAANYSDAAYAEMGKLEDAYRAARAAMESADGEFEHCQLVEVGVRRR